MLAPLGLVVVTKVPIKCLLAPGAVTRVRDGGECADGLVFAGVTEELPLVSTTHLLTQSHKTQSHKGRLKEQGGKYSRQSSMPTTCRNALVLEGHPMLPT